MKNVDAEVRDALIAPMEEARESWGSAPRNTAPTVAAESPNRPKRSSGKSTDRLPRGIRRRGDSLVIYLTHPDGSAERRSLGNVSIGTAVREREIEQRKIEEGKYVKKVPRVAMVLFSDIADKALEHAKNCKRCWNADAVRGRLLKKWWGDRPADSITTQEIDAKLLENVGTRGFRWTETTSNEYRATLSHIFKLAIDRGELTINPAQKAHRYTLNNARTRELSFAEEDRLRKASRELLSRERAGIRFDSPYRRTPVKPLRNSGRGKATNAAAGLEGSEPRLENN